MLALACVLVGWLGLKRDSAGLRIERQSIGAIPAIVFSPGDEERHPTIVVAHGFAGSQELMQALAVTLAGNGFIAVTFDFSGHGRNPRALAGGLVDLGASTQALLGDLERVVAFARSLPDGDGRVALVGHSMASELVVQFAMGRKDIEAVAALSLFGREVTREDPRNLLIVDGAWEPGVLTDAARRIVALAAPDAPAPRVTYGDMAQGTARRFALARGAEHIGVVFARDTMREVRDWMRAAFQVPGKASGVAARGPWLGLMFLGLIALAAPLAAGLPKLAPARLGAGLRWRALLPATLGPAIATPLLLWQAPELGLPLLLGDYLAAHFALYGALTLLALKLAGGEPSRVFAMPARPVPTALAVVAVLAFAFVALGLPIDRWITSLALPPHRLPYLPLVACGTLLYWLADEWVTRGAGAARGAVVFSRLCFLLSLALAIALNPARLFFLAIITPAILVFFLVFGFVGACVTARVRDPRVVACAFAVALAWAISAVFPVVG